MTSSPVDGGFTLIEAIIALAIASFAIVTLGGLIAFMAGQAQRSTQSEAEIGADVAVASLLQRITGAIAGNPGSFQLADSNLALTTFSGPQSLAAFGPTRMVLADQSDGTTQSLLLRLDENHADLLSPSGRDQQILLAGVTHLAIAAHRPSGWLSTWATANSLPDRLRLTWRDPDNTDREVIALVSPRQTTTSCLRNPSRRDCLGAAP